jgi:Tol biopolymer transport system component
MLYEIGTGAHPLDVSRYGYRTKASNTMFTSPSFSPDGHWLTWWASEGSPEHQKQFSLVIFDLTGKTSAALHSYTPPVGTSGWLDAPTWSPDGQWIAFQTRSEFTPWDLWIIREDGTMEQRFGLATNPVWSPDSQRLAYVQQSPRSDPSGTANLSIINVPSWDIRQNCVATGGGIPLAWTAIIP